MKMRAKWFTIRSIINIVYEYSRFVWAFPYKGTSSETVIKIYHGLFATYGTPGTIHSDRGSGFVSTNIRMYLSELGVNISTTTPNNLDGKRSV